jgi:hypothetical protein
MTQGRVLADISMSLVGEGVRLFDELGTQQIELESTRVVESPGVTHLRFRLAR